MGNNPENPIVPNQGTTENSASPSSLKEKEMQEFLRDLEERGFAVEEFFSAVRKLSEQKINELKQKLQEITSEIQKLQAQKQSIIAEIQRLSGIPQNRKTSARTGIVGSGDTKNLRFTLDGVEMPASQIALQLGLSKTSSTNWKRVFQSVLNGNSGGLTAEEQEEVRNRVSIIQ